jgi:hypothetical protein
LLGLIKKLSWFGKGYSMNKKILSWLKSNYLLNCALSLSKFLLKRGKNLISYYVIGNRKICSLLGLFFQKRARQLRGCSDLHKFFKLLLDSVYYEGGVLIWNI